MLQFYTVIFSIILGYIYYRLITILIGHASRRLSIWRYPSYWTKSDIVINQLKGWSLVILVVILFILPIVISIIF